MPTEDREGLQESILARLSRVIDPETEVDVVRMRLIEDLKVDDNGWVSYRFRPSSPFCPLAVPLILSIRQAVAEPHDGRKDHEAGVEEDCRPTENHIPQSLPPCMSAPTLP